MEQIAERVVARLFGTARDGRDDESMLADLARRHAEEVTESAACDILENTASEEDGK